MGIIYRFISTGDNVIGQVEQLYTSAFPESERREFADFLALLSAESVPFRLMGAFDSDDDSRLLAFITCWDLDGIMYLEHFAVIPQMRGHGVGSTVFRHFLDNEAARIVLEVEPPTTPIAVKRIKFYEALGLKLWGDFHYVQPSYGIGKPSIELKLMTHGDVDSDELAVIAQQVHKVVYGVN